MIICHTIVIMTYPLKFREQAFQIKEKYNLTFSETSERLDIPIRTLFRWQQRIEPCIKRNRQASKLNMEALLKDVEDKPDDYQWERAKRLGVADRTIGYGLKRLGLSYKKNSKTSQGQRRRAYQVYK